MRFLVATAAEEGAVPHAAVMDWLRDGGPFIPGDGATLVLVVMLKARVKYIREASVQW
jgi:hypothetical protein